MGILRLGIMVMLTVVSMAKPDILSQHFEYDEIRDPAMAVSMEAMRAHQIQYTMYSFYSINVDTPGFVEIGGYNRRVKGTNKIRMIPFYRWRAGPIIETDRDLDFTVDAGSRGFFTVQLPNIVGYTRDGRFQIDSQGRLVLLNGGYPVLGESGPIIVPEGASLTSATSGMLFADGDTVGKLRVAVFTDQGRDSLVSINGSIFILDGSRPDLLAGEEYYKIRQGFLEQNNVLKAIVGDVSMLKRAYEGIAKVAKITNRAMSSAVQLGQP